MKFFSAAGRVSLVLGAALALAVAAAACSADEVMEKASSSSAPTAASNGASSGPATKPSVDAAGRITIIGKDNGTTNNRFEPKEFTAPANQKITVTLDNQGTAIHNWQIVGQKGPDGQEIQTPLLPAGQKGNVEFSLPAGTYDFYCAVHPVDMRGKLTVQ
jgi:plastocyanin